MAAIPHPRAVEPETRYARSGDLHIAYQVVGEGPPDLVALPGFVSHLEHQWEDVKVATFWQRLASFSRLILIDKRGTGLSDRVPVKELPTLEERMDDLRAVMNEAGSERAALLGFWEGAPMSALFAATYPQRTTALILYGPMACFTRSDDYPWGLSSEEDEDRMRRIEQSWGRGAFLSATTPSIADDEQALQWLARLERLGASPGAAVALWRMNTAIDVRPVLPTIRVPTLVLHRRDDTLVPLAAGRDVAHRIPGARFVELPGRDHLPWVGDSDAIIDEIQEFLTGVRGSPDADRILATVLFTDIVQSTQRAAELGDQRWRRVLDSHYALVRRALTRFRGREVKTTGDGFLASFDGPARAVRCAGAIIEGARQLDLEVRAGIHTGECEVRGDDLGGIAVHIGARVVALAGPGEVLVSSTVKDLVAGSGLEFEDRGRHALKGVPDEWRLYQVHS